MVPRKCKACGKSFLAADFDTPHQGCPSEAPKESPSALVRPRKKREAGDGVSE